MEILNNTKLRSRLLSAISPIPRPNQDANNVHFFFLICSLARLYFLWFLELNELRRTVSITLMDIGSKAKKIGAWASTKLFVRWKWTRLITPYASISSLTCRRSWPQDRCATIPIVVCWWGPANAACRWTARKECGSARDDCGNGGGSS